MTVMTRQHRVNRPLPTPAEPRRHWSFRLVVTLSVTVIFLSWLLLFAVASY